MKNWRFKFTNLIHPPISRSAIDITLHRLLKKGTLRRVIRGIYDYPKYSETLKTVLSPDSDQVAQALVRRFGWRIQFTGSTALNILGLSTQVPARIVYLSDGPLTLRPLGWRRCGKIILENVRSQKKKSVLVENPKN